MKADSASGSQKTILLVDDEPQVRTLLGMSLRSAGFRVVEAECALKALAIIEQNGIECVDVLVTDIEMPKMDGITLAKQCKRRIRDLQVIAISAFADIARPAIGTILDAFVQKPFLPKVLIKTVEDVLQRSVDPAQTI
jgi:CheY-like chemotaxis protein